MSVFNIDFCGTYIVVYTLDTYYYCTRTRNVCNDRINQESLRFQSIRLYAPPSFIQKELVHIDVVCFWLRVYHNAFQKCLFLLSSIYRLGLPFEIFHLHKYKNDFFHARTIMYELIDDDGIHSYFSIYTIYLHLWVMCTWALSLVPSIHKKQSRFRNTTTIQPYLNQINRSA